MNRQPSRIKIITIDYAAFLSALFPPISWGFYLILRLMGEPMAQAPFLPAIFGVITVLGIGVLAWRIQLINTVFTDGIEASATISRISFFRDRGRVDYYYLYQNQKYSSGAAVMKVKRTRDLNIGDQVIVVVDRNQPKRAFIRDLYS